MESPLFHFRTHGPPDHAASGAIVYVSFCTGVVSSFASPVSTGPGTLFRSPVFLSFAGTVRYANGIVWISANQVPQLDPAQDAIQSMQSGSCSAPMMSVPPCFGATVLAGAPDCFALEPQAPNTTARLANKATKRTEPRR